MKTMEEIYTEMECSSKRDILEAMKAYAMQECEKVRQQCADNAKVIKTGNSGSYYDASVDKQSILSTPIELT